MILYTYFRSSAAYRARIALHLKQLPFESRFIHLLRSGGEQHAADYRKLNPLGRVPTLIDGDVTLTQSLAIMEYLDERYPEHPLLPAGTANRAIVRAMTLTIVADTQPLSNLSVLHYLRRELNIAKPGVDAWAKYWLANGLSALEALLADSQERGRFCFGDRPTMADICLVAQCAAARRFEVPFDALPHVARIDATCATREAFQRAAPQAQADFEAMPA